MKTERFGEAERPQLEEEKSPGIGTWKVELTLQEPVEARRIPEQKEVALGRFDPRKSASDMGVIGVFVLTMVLTILT